MEWSVVGRSNAFMCLFAECRVQQRLSDRIFNSIFMCAFSDLKTYIKFTLLYLRVHLLTHIESMFGWHQTTPHQTFVVRTTCIFICWCCWFIDLTATGDALFALTHSLTSCSLPLCLYHPTHMDVYADFKHLLVCKCLRLPTKHYAQLHIVENVFRKRAKKIVYKIKSRTHSVLSMDGSALYYRTVCASNRFLRCKYYFATVKFT